MDILNILGNENRRKILKILTKRNIHISGIARELDISPPVALRHIVLLESADLVERINVGNIVLIKIKDETVDLLKKLEDLFEKPTVLKVKKGKTLLDAMKHLDGIEIRKWPGTDKYYIYSIDKTKGFYIYMVDGVIPDKSADEFIIEDDLIVEFQKLTPVVGRKIEIKTEE